MGNVLFRQHSEISGLLPGIESQFWPICVGFLCLYVSQSKNMMVVSNNCCKELVNLKILYLLFPYK